ncbi:MAG TPA: hypothetical protein VN764_17490 [Polyangiaceae bacterium]|nr:hypothetical protein [Polyangiaceae bacterium]
MNDRVADSTSRSYMTLQERLADLERIAQLADPVLRNLLITQRYHDLSHGLTSVLGSGNANWSTFACWASRTAGISIRMQEIPEEFTAALRVEAAFEKKAKELSGKLGFVGRWLIPQQNPLDLARAVIVEVATQIAEGNLKVYAELAPLFAKFASEFSNPSSRTEERWNAFFDDFKAGSAAEGGQDDLQKAFKAYLKAADTEDEILKAQLILYGNVMIGLHEQTRLQKNIAGGINAMFSDQVYDKFFAQSTWIFRDKVKWLIERVMHLVERQFMKDWQMFATRFMMRLSTPDGHEIPLGEDLPGGEFAPELATLTFADLIKLMSTYDKDLKTTKGSRAINWVILDDRMRFIGELFRVKQRHAKWFEQPFREEIRRAFEAGQVPPGSLD